MGYNFKQIEPQNVNSAEVENTDFYCAASQNSRLTLYTHIYFPIQVFVVYVSLFNTEKINYKVV